MVFLSLSKDPRSCNFLNINRIIPKNLLHSFYKSNHPFFRLPVIFIPTKPYFSVIAGIIKSLQCITKFLFVLPPVSVSHYLIKKKVM